MEHNLLQVNFGLATAHCCWAMCRLGLQRYAATLALHEEKDFFQTCVLLNNVNNSMARSKVTNVATVVMEEQERPSSGY
jgi:hypothetical protein